ncbi:MAG: hypothetical protein WCF02_14255 [Azonexus sp.]|jgi:hypothetical protein
MSSITKRLLMASAVAAALALPTVASAQWGGYPGNWGGPGWGNNNWGGPGWGNNNWGGPGWGNNNWGNNNWGGRGWDDVSGSGYGRGYGSGYGRGTGRGTGRGHFGFNMDTDMNGWTDEFFNGNGWGNNGYNGWGNNGWGNNGNNSWGPWRRGWW